MENGTLLLLTFLIATIIGLFIQLALYLNRKKQERIYPEIWREFEESKKRQLHDDTIKFGNQLVYNDFVQKAHLIKVLKTAKKLETTYPSYKELRINAYNKWKDRTRIIDPRNSNTH